jgi:hypothetical protein
MTVSGTPGTGTVTLGSAFSNAYLTLNEAGVANGDVVSYFIEDASDFEIGIGTYTSAGTTLSRDTVTLSKISGTSGTTKLTLTNAALVYLSPRKEDLLSVSETQVANKVLAGPTSGGAATPTFRSLVAADLPSAGAVLQVIQATYTANADLTVGIPFDDTIPTNTEGTQIISQAITPASSSNKVLCSVSVWGHVVAGVQGDGFAVALFRGSTCIQVAFTSAIDDNGTSPTQLFQNVSFEFQDSPASASAQTYSVRVGGNASTIRLNGSTTGRKFGGASASVLRLMETT